MQPNLKTHQSSRTFGKFLKWKTVFCLICCHIDTLPDKKCQWSMCLSKMIHNNSCSIVFSDLFGFEAFDDSWMFHDQSFVWIMILVFFRRLTCTHKQIVFFTQCFFKKFSLKTAISLRHYWFSLLFSLVDWKVWDLIHLIEYWFNGLFCLCVDFLSRNLPLGF